MLPIATVRWSKREFIAQGPDAAWEQLRQRLAARNLTQLSEKIRRELDKPLAGQARRRITFVGAEMMPVIEIIQE